MRIFFVLLACLLACVLPAREGFEEDALPQRWTVQRSKASVCRVRAKAGESALRWEWRDSQAVLSWKFEPVTVKPKENFGMWLYSPGFYNRLQVGFYHQGRFLGGVWYNLNYAGWWPCSLQYGTIEAQTVDEIRFSLPGNFRQGILWFDEITVNGAKHAPRRDTVHPWVGQTDWLQRPFAQSAFSAENIAINRSWLPPLIPENRIPEKAKADMQQLEKSLGRRLHYSKNRNYGSLTELRTSTIDALALKETNGIIKGRPIQFNNGQNPLPIDEAVDFIREIIPMMEKLCTAYSREKGAAKEEVERMYLLLCRHILDQGFQEGNAQIGWLGNGYDIRHYPATVYRMQDVLRKGGLLAPMVKSTLWIAEGHGVLAENPSTYCDGIYNYTIHLPTGTALIPDIAERYQRLRALKRYYDLVITRNGPFYDDGSIHHHGGHHLAYGSYSLPALTAHQLRPFANTEFAIGPDAKKRLLAVLNACHLQAVNGYLAPTLMLRSGVGARFNPIGVAGDLARLPTAKHTAFDPEAAAIYMNLQNNPNDEFYKTLAAAGVVPCPPEGHHAMNTTALSIHRRKDWQIVLAGMVAGFRGLEIYGWTETNNYDENSRNGSVYLKTKGDDGFLTEGWDHNCWPGTTVIRNSESDLFQGYTMRGNGSELCGGVDNGQNGVWGGEFKVNQLTFKKSAFCFGDTVTVITTDIARTGKTTAPIITTLLQEGRKESPRNLAINGKTVSGFPFETVLTDYPATLTDDRQNGYYIHPGSAPLTVQRHEQHWTYFFKRYLKDKNNNPCIDIRKKQFKEKPLSENAAYYSSTQGFYSLATFNHSENASACAYTILPACGIEGSGRFAQTMQSSQPPLTILSETSALHAVHHVGLRLSGYVVFDPEKAVFPRGSILQSASLPGFYLIEEGAGQIRVHYATSNRKLAGQTVTVQLSTQPKPLHLPVNDILSSATILRVQ